LNMDVDYEKELQNVNSGTETTTALQSMS
jgi:hypothetical protein